MESIKKECTLSKIDVENISTKIQKLIEWKSVRWVETNQSTKPGITTTR
jgi:hypothetical protein